MANISTTSLGLTLDTSSYTKNLKSAQRSTSVVLKSLNDQAQVFSDSWADITKNLRSAKSVASSMPLYGTFTAIATGASLATVAIADSSANPAWVAADLLAPAEHDIVAQPVLATPDENLAKAVAEEIEKQLASLETKETACASINNCGRIIITDSLEQAAEFANRKAPEHLELAMEDSEARQKIQNLVHNYGSLFIGHYSAEVLGDYAAGLNHTLPTSGTAKYTGGLSVRMFLKTVTTLRAKKDSAGLFRSAAAAGSLGDAEGLAGHARAARIRIEK